MGRVMPFILVSVGLVIAAVVQAQTSRKELTATPLAPVEAIEVEPLETLETP